LQNYDLTSRKVNTNNKISILLLSDILFYYVICFKIYFLNSYSKFILKNKLKKVKFYFRILLLPDQQSTTVTYAYLGAMVARLSCAAKAILSNKIFDP